MFPIPHGEYHVQKLAKASVSGGVLWDVLSVLYQQLGCGSEASKVGYVGVQ